MKKSILTALVAVISMTMVANVAVAAEGRVKARGKNGAVAAGTYNGNSYARGHGKTVNSDGSVTAASGAGFTTAAGASGARGSTTTINTDGSATHQGGMSTQGAKGSVDSQGSVTYNADGTATGSRTTNATNAANGNSYTGTTSYDSATGVSRQATCYDAAGAVMTCPTR